MKHLVIVNGYPRVGKDTLISEMISQLQARGIKAINCSMIDPTIEMLRAHPAIPSSTFINKTAVQRKLLASVHRALLDYSNYPIAAVFAAAKEAGAVVLFTCCREPDTIQRMVDVCRSTAWKATTVFVQRQGHETPVTEADRCVEQYNYDIQVDNNQPLVFLPHLARDTLQKIYAASDRAVPLA